MAAQDGPKKSRGRRPIRRARGTTGKLRIGDDWNAITIIALSQSNPLKAIAAGAIWNEKLVTHVVPVEKAEVVYEAGAVKSGGYLEGVITF